MNCPDCNAPDYYSGIFGGNCTNPTCCHFKQGKVNGTKVLETQDQEWVMLEDYDPIDAIHTPRSPANRPELIVFDHGSEKRWLCGPLEHWDGGSIHGMTNNQVNWVEGDSPENVVARYDAGERGRGD